LRSPQAIETTIAIIDTFAKFRELTNSVHQFAKASNDVQKIKILDSGAK